MSRVVLTATALVWWVAAPAAAQTADVGLIADAEPADVAFMQFVDVPAARRFSAMAVAREDPNVAFIVDLRGADGVVRIWRRRDRATLERRLEEPDPEGYALAVIGSELLEVARAGSMAEVVAVDPVEAIDPVESDGAAVDGASGAPEADGSPPGDAARERVSFTGGVAFEAWVMPETTAPFQLQPAVAFELAYSPSDEDWQLGGGVFASGLGFFDRRESGVEARYQRYDLGVRVTFGGAVGPVRTRLLGHARVGGSAILGRAEDNSGMNGREGSAAVAGAFLGPAFEVRQPLIAGLELTLDVAADVIFEPVSFFAGGDETVRESPLRLSARLGVAYRVE